MGKTNLDILVSKRPFEIKTASYSISAGDSGTVFGIGTDAIVLTLPATVAGLIYSFVNTGADGNNLITISPNASDAIHGTATLAASVVEFGGVDDKDIINTKATANTGDVITLVGDGVAGWYVLNSTGIWASEA